MGHPSTFAFLTSLSRHLRRGDRLEDAFDVTEGGGGDPAAACSGTDTHRQAVDRWRSARRAAIPGRGPDDGA